jgi:hypothetical protein
VRALSVSMGYASPFFVSHDEDTPVFKAPFIHWKHLRNLESEVSAQSNNAVLMHGMATPRARLQLVLGFLSRV